MTAGPSPDPLRRDLPPPETAPLTGPESRLHRYLPDGDPEHRAQQYLRESDPRARAERYLADAAQGAVEAMVEAVAEQRRAAGHRSHLEHLQELAAVLRTAPISQAGLQEAVGLVREAAGADAVVLTLSAPHPEQVVSGTPPAGGARVAHPIRADGAAAGELLACRVPGAAEFAGDDERFLALAADQFALLVARAAAASALEPADKHFVDVLVSRMRAPLGSIAGAVEQLATGGTGSLAADEERHLRVAAEHVGQLVAILRDLQTLSRLRRHERHEMEDIGIGPLLTRAAARARPALDARAVGLQMHEPGEALLVKGVPEQLDRALGAILDNAVKFSRQGGTITVSARRVDDWVRIEIADDGMGMDQAEAEMAFERFTRGSAAQGSGVPGLGLGLTIVKEVMDLHGGRAWAESASGRGTCVHLRIPAAAA
jgi:signal transduction histidine kinase